MKRSTFKQILVPLPDDPLFIAAAVCRAWVNAALVTGFSTWYNISRSELSKRAFIFGVGICVGSMAYWAVKLYGELKRYESILSQMQSDPLLNDDKKN